jgi:hypothetical protein
MLSLVKILILFFIILLIYQIFLAYIGNTIEGLENEYNPYPPNALILAQQNAGNIEFLKKKMEDLTGLNKEVQDISGNVVTLQDQVNQMVIAQQQYATQMTGGTPPTISGTGSTSDETS